MSKSLIYNMLQSSIKHVCDDNGDERGKEAENFVESELLKLNIPYKRNVKFLKRVKGVKKYKKELVSEFDFIIPNAIIEVKASLQTQTGIYRNLRVETIISQLQRQLSIIPENFNIYLFIKEKVEDNESIKSIEFCKRIKILNSIDEIVYNNLPIIIDDFRCLKSLASLENKNINNIIKLYSNKIINVTKDKYDKLLSLLNLNLISIMKTKMMLIVIS